MQMTPDQVTILHQMALKNLEYECRITQNVIAAIPADKSSYKPDPAAMTALDLAKHLALCEIHFLNGIMTGKFDFSGQLPAGVEAPAEIAKWFGDESAKTREKLAAMPTEKLAEVIDFMGAIQMPAVMFLNLAMSHSVHHRGQLSTHLRPMGAKVPSIYGTSYDDEQAKKAAAGA
jgi:uncharacterized damage-inducible protein DinB